MHERHMLIQKSNVPCLYYNLFTNIFCAYRISTYISPIHIYIYISILIARNVQRWHYMYGLSLAPWVKKVVATSLFYVDAYACILLNTWFVCKIDKQSHMLHVGGAASSLLVDNVSNYIYTRTRPSHVPIFPCIHHTPVVVITFLNYVLVKEYWSKHQ